MPNASGAVTATVLTFGWTLLGGVAASAQEPRDTFELEEIVVTATRMPIPREAAPTHVSVISGEELRARGIDHVLEALRALPGAAVVQTGSFGGATSLFLRGGESDYVQVLVDGVPVNEPGGSFNFATLTTHNIERIEVVRGPASALYGSDAVAGVVQIFTRRGEGPLRGSLAFKRGTYGTQEWSSDFTGGGEAARYAFSLSRFASDGILAFNNEYQNTVLNGRVAVTPDAVTEASLSLRYSDHEFHVPTDGGGNVTDENAFEFGDALTLGLELARDFGERVGGRLLLTTYERNGGFDDRADAPSDTLGFYASRSLDDVRRLTADARADVRIGPSAVLTGGFEVEEESQRSFSQSESEFGSSNPPPIDVERWNRAYYGQIFSDFDSGLAVTAGLRLDDNAAFGTFTTYRAGAAYRPAHGTRVHASIGTALKEPTFFENYAEGFARGNPELDPERSRSWEIGLEQAFLGEDLTAYATYFDQRFRDLIQFTPDSAGPSFFNVAEAVARGIETGVRVEALRDLSFSADYTYLHSSVEDAGFDTGPDANFVEDQRLLRRPSHTARLHARARVSDRGSLALDVQHVGERDDLDFSAFPSPRVRLPSYTRFDLAAQYEVHQAREGLPGFTVTFRLDNAFDKAYEEVKNFPARGRTVFIGGRVDF